MGGKIKEACGRCGLSSVVDMSDGEDAEGDGHPFGEQRIEVPETKLRRVMFPVVWLSRVKTRVNRIATRLTYGDRL